VIEKRREGGEWPVSGSNKIGRALAIKLHPHLIVIALAMYIVIELGAHTPVSNQTQEMRKTLEFWLKCG